MIRGLAALVEGPDWQGKPATRGRMLAILPFLGLALAAGGAAILGAAVAPAWPGPADFGLAGLAMLLCLCLSWPASLQEPATLWWLPLWLAPGVGLAGWALLPLAAGWPARLASPVALCAPIMVVALAVAWRRIPAGMEMASAAAGAGWLRRAGLRWHHAWRGVALACALVFWVCLRLVTP